jgi:beta-lactam-binding protein with PASTA domain
VPRSLCLGACALATSAVALGFAAGASPRAEAVPKRCVVPKVVGMRMVSARIFVLAGGCRVGRIARVGSVTVPRRRVISQRPAAGKRLRARARVNVVVSSGTTKR